MYLSAVVTLYVTLDFMHKTDNALVKYDALLENKLYLVEPND